MATSMRGSKAKGTAAPGKTSMKGSRTLGSGAPGKTTMTGSKSGYGRGSSGGSNQKRQSGQLNQ